MSLSHYKLKFNGMKMMYHSVPTKPIVWFCRQALIVLLFFSSMGIYAQNIVTGKITDSKGETLPAVNVIIKGTTTGVFADMDGIQVGF